MKKVLMFALVSTFAYGAEDEVAHRAKLTRKVLASIKDAACKGDESGVLNYFFYKRTNWQFSQYQEDLMELVQKKYGREANALDAEKETKQMQALWTAYFNEIKADVKKKSNAELCALSVVEVKQLPNNRAVTALVKFKDEKSDTWYIAEGRAAFDPDYGGPEMIVDQNTRMRNEMKKHFPTIIFAADNTVDPQ